jgi:hypothetical protein
MMIMVDIKDATSGRWLCRINALLNNHFNLTTKLYR